MIIRVQETIYFVSCSILLSTILLLGGCASLEKHSVVKTIVLEPEAEKARDLTNFDLIGRISVKTNNDGFSGGIRWQHKNHFHHLLLLSPIGQVVAQIAQDDQGIQLITSDQKIYYAASIEALTEQVFGWKLPIIGLEYWIMGRANPLIVAEIDMDRDDQVIAIRQDGWEITYLDYFSRSVPQHNKVKSAPRIIELNYPNLKLKLVIDSWKNIN
ncbi:MAG TPA: lipoprotein insertase outer membrane protein LolB [Nitrosomonas sp.]|nr:lipoprotein insertase outer membrane protein LolB [Nitrosomonas sp.]HNJ92050.1 lipoprotein insertase outer membrane protein LolB [Nitrosomonas sp.]